MKRAPFIVAVAALFAIGAGWRWETTGQAVVIDGDTIRLDGGKVGLEGIDAPERDQTCWVEHGYSYDCGAASKQYLEYLIDGDDVTCGANALGRDGRKLGICHVGDVNLNAAMVRAGWALAYRRDSTAYVEDEEQARNAGIGMWAGSFIPPWEYRHR